MAAFWTEISAAKLRQDSGLTVEEVKAGTLAAMDAFITERNADNGVAVRREIDNASGPYTFTSEGFSEDDLTGLFPGKTAAQRVAEGADLLILAQSVVRFRTLAELEARKTPEPGTTNTMPRFYEAQAEKVMAQIVEAIKEALLGPQRDAPEDAQRSGSVRMRPRWYHAAR